MIEDDTPLLPMPTTWPAPPTGVSQLGYLLLICVGGLMALAGALYGLLATARGAQVADGVLAISVFAVGVVFAVQGSAALTPRRWRALSPSSTWIWIGLLVTIWLLGILFIQIAPRSLPLIMPPVIIAGAGVASLAFLNLTLHGLHVPVQRKPLLSGMLLPRHIVLLSASISAVFSTLLSLALEGTLIAIVIGILLAMTEWLGDASTLDMVRHLGQSQDTIQQLEAMLVQSPIALAALGCILVFVAPGIEEAAKSLPLLLLGRQKSRLTEQVAILIGVAGGVGFAFAENVGYLSMLVDAWWLAFGLRIGAAIMHGAASGFIGRGWHRGVRKGQWGAMLLDLIKGWGIHASWNALALLVGWFAYRGQMVGVLFCVLVGLLPLASLFALLARWGIWVSET
jgi:RsiW-degrading membrane proteinase PrsW (M82 family)